MDFADRSRDPSWLFILSVFHPWLTMPRRHDYSREPRTGLGQRVDNREKGELSMTTQQLHRFNALYLGFLIVVAILTRATARRISGALVGSAVGGVAALWVICVGGGFGGGPVGSAS